MLSDSIKHNNKMQYLQLLTKLSVDLTAFTELLNKINYFEAPAFSQNAQNNKTYPGGLCQHALDVYNELIQLCNAYFPGKYTEEDVIKVALLKDLYRAELFENYYKPVKNDETGNWDKVLSCRTKEIRQVYGDIGFSSFMLANKYFTFTDEQIEAICFGSCNSIQTTDLHNIRRIYPLVLMTTMADLAACYLD